jgi:ADP-ribose pyrophosphatase YjhB (NUDIX family)
MNADRVNTPESQPTRDLSDYPRPSVAIDAAVLTVIDGALHVVIVDDARDHTRRLPGTFLHEGEWLADAVSRCLADKAGITGLDPVQLHVFDSPDRDDRGRVISVAHLATVPARWGRASLASRPASSPARRARNARRPHAAPMWRDPLPGRATVVVTGSG